MEKIAIIGAGSMAEAIIARLVKNKLINNNKIYLTNNSNVERLKQMEETYGVTGTYDNNELLQDADFVILAMKPKDLENAFQNIKQYLKKDSVIVSVLAGISINSIAAHAGQELPIVRAMPNTSATIGKSATCLAINSLVSDEQKQVLKKLFETIGSVTFVKEEQLDAVTGLSGSGPAYIYYVVESLQKAAQEVGLEEETAKQLIVQTLIGAAEMVAQSEKTPEQLRKEVMSPGGTTEAGIKVLQSYNVSEAFRQCVKEATAQAKRLGQN